MKRIHILAASLLIFCSAACSETVRDNVFTERPSGSTEVADPASSGNNDAECDTDENPTDGSETMAGHYADAEYTVIPKNLPSQIKRYEGFTVCFNADNHTPNWVGWEFLASEADGDASRGNNFWYDEDLEGCPFHYDYSRSGYDRGHMCPAADQKWSEQAMADCFVMANMCPQDHALNSGAWATLEKKERIWAKRDGTLIIIAGPIYEKSDTKRLGDTGVRVPSAFFKVIAAPYIDKPRGIAFVYPNMTAPGNMSNYAMSIDEMEELTGFDFLSSLPDELEDKIETTYSFKEWDK